MEIGGNSDLYVDIRHTVIYIWISDTLRLTSGYKTHLDLYIDIRHPQIYIRISDKLIFRSEYHTNLDLYPDIRHTEIYISISDTLSIRILDTLIFISIYWISNTLKFTSEFQSHCFERVIKLYLPIKMRL